MTFHAYDHAVEAGADILEMNVQLTADGVLIVQHDGTVDGTTDGTGRVDEPAFQVPPRFGDVDVITPAFWEAVDAAGATVWMWPNDASTQENAAFYQEMIDQGVTGIVAGRPSEVPA